MLYSHDFYAAQAPDSERSARAVLPLLLPFITPGSIIDIGCGTGCWARLAAELLNCRVLGVDGRYVPLSLRHLSPDEFCEADLSRPLPPLPRADLVLSLEVAEHLPPERAEGFVADLAGLSDAVLFSAAQPQQGGTGHLNENWLEYWAILFRRHDFEARDILRPLIWNDQEVNWWYRQNLILFVRPRALGRPPFTDRLPAISEPPQPLSRIHPVQYLLRMSNPPSPAPGGVGGDLRYYSALLDAYLSGADTLPSSCLNYQSDALR